MKKLTTIVMMIMAMTLLGSCDRTDNPPTPPEPEKTPLSIVGMWTCSSVEVFYEDGMSMIVPVATLEELFIFSFEENGVGGMGVYEEDQYVEEAAFASYVCGDDGSITIVSDGEEIVGKYTFDGDDNLRLELGNETEKVAYNLIRGIHPEFLIPEEEPELPAPSPTDPVKNTIWQLTAISEDVDGVEINISVDTIYENGAHEIHFGNDGTGEMCVVTYSDEGSLSDKDPFTYTYDSENGMICFVYTSDYTSDDSYSDEYRVVREGDQMRLIGYEGDVKVTLYFTLIDKCGAES